MFRKKRKKKKNVCRGNRREKELLIEIYEA
jgi:hypothetical protein